MQSQNDFSLFGCHSHCTKSDRFNLGRYWVYWRVGTGENFESNWRGILPKPFSISNYSLSFMLLYQHIFLSVACWAERNTNPEEGPCELDHFSLFSSVLPWSERSRRWWWVQSCTSAERQYHGRQYDGTSVRCFPWVDNTMFARYASCIFFASKNSQFSLDQRGVDK